MKEMSPVDGALHFVSQGLMRALSETELAKLRDRLRAALVSHGLPTKDPRTNPPLAEGEKLPSEDAFLNMLRDAREALWAKKDALIAENRITIRYKRAVAKVNKAIRNLHRDHRAGARRALEAMATGGQTPSWILRSVAVAAAK